MTLPNKYCLYSKGKQNTVWSTAVDISWGYIWLTLCEKIMTLCVRFEILSAVSTRCDAVHSGTEVQYRCFRGILNRKAGLALLAYLGSKEIGSLWLTYLLTFLLTPRSRVLLEKLTGLQPVKKFPAFYGTRRFITVLTSACQLYLSWSSSIQSIPHIPLPEDPS